MLGKETEPGLRKWLMHHLAHSCPGNVDVSNVSITNRAHVLVEASFLGIAHWSVLLMILQAVQILVPFPAAIAPEWLFFFHTHSAGVRDVGIGIDD